MKLSEFRGVDPKIKQLLRSAQTGNIMHALLFSGSAGTGKRSMAEIIARASLCNGEGVRPCDQCPACRRFNDGVHPDVHIVDLEEDRKQIRIEQIRELQEKLALASYEGGKKIVIIDHADTMNGNSQNALLKTLEEPVGDTLFFLLTTTPGALLPTIISRCLQVRFYALDTKLCAEVLESRGIDALRADLSAALAAGCVGRALEIADDDGYFDYRTDVINAIESIRSAGDVPNAVSVIGRIGSNAMGDKLLEILELWAWELMRVQNGNEPIVKRDLDKLSRSRINGNRLLRGVETARQKRNVNIAWANIIEPLLFNIADM